MRMLQQVQHIRIKKNKYKAEAFETLLDYRIVYNQYLAIYLYLQNKYKFKMKYLMHESFWSALVSPKLKKSVNSKYKLYREALHKDSKIKSHVLRIQETNSIIRQQGIKLLLQNIKAFFAAIKEYKKNPEKFKEKPEFPNYKPISKFNNESLLITKDYFYFDRVKTDILIIKPYGKKNDSTIIIRIPNFIKSDEISSISIERKLDDYYISLRYKIEISECELNSNYYLGIDMGLNNLATCVSNNPEMKSFIIDGNELKGINFKLAHMIENFKSKKQKSNIRAASRFRVRKIKSLFHQISAKIIQFAYQFKIKTIVIGKNITELKNGLKIGKQNNKLLYSIPHAILIQMIQNKAEKFGIKVELVDESYTSKTSSLTAKSPNTNNVSKDYKRVNRGLFLDLKINKAFNADCNGALNIIKKLINDIVETLSFKQWLAKLATPITIKLSTINLSSSKISLRIE